MPDDFFHFKRQGDRETERHPVYWMDVYPEEGPTRHVWIERGVWGASKWTIRTAEAEPSTPIADLDPENIDVYDDRETAHQAAVEWLADR